MSAYTKTIAWSKHGFIAYANPGGAYNVGITHMEVVDGKMWQLADPQTFAIQPPVNAEASNGLKRNGNTVKGSDDNLSPVSHLEWSTVGDYLGCLDTHGNMTILGGGICKETNDQYNYSPFNDFVVLYNDTVAESPRKSPMSTTTSDPKDRLRGLSHNHRPSTTTITEAGEGMYFGGDYSTRVIGFEWLPTHKNNYGVVPASKVALSSDTVKTDLQNEPATFQFRYKYQPQVPLGFSHPVATKQACIGIRRNGELCLWYQGTHRLNFLRSTVSLDDEPGDASRYENALLSHANLGFQRSGSILLVTYSPFSRLLKVYLVSIDWGSLKKNGNEKRKDDVVVPPKLLVKRVAKEYIPPLGLAGSPQKLNHIKVVSSNYTSDAEQDIYLVFDEPHGGSTLHRYHLSSMVLNQENMFFKNSAGVKNQDTSTSIERHLSLKEMLQFEKHVSHFDTVGRNMFVYCVLEDGTIELRQAKNLKKKCGGSSAAVNDDDKEKYVMSLFDAGFKIHQIKERTSFVLLSPNLAAAVYLMHDKNKEQPPLILKLAESSSKKDRASLSFGERLTVSAAFAVSHSESCFASSCCDDLIAAAQLEISKYKSTQHQDSLIDTINQESHAALKFSLNYANDQLDKLLGNPPLQKLIGLQMSLGTGIKWTRTKSGKIAWAVLNLRSCAFGIMITLKAWFKDMQKIAMMKKDLKYKNLPTLQFVNINWRAEVIASVLGVVKWIMNFIVFLYQDFLGITMLSAGNQRRFQQAFMESLAMPILMAKVPRVILSNAIKGFKQLLSFASKFIEEFRLGSDNVVFAATERLREIINDSLIDLELFEKFLGNVEYAVKSSITNYKKAKGTTSDPLVIEQKLVCQGKIPEELMDAAKIILKLFNDSLCKDLDRSKVFFYDLKWLGLWDGEQDDDSSSSPRSSRGSPGVSVIPGSAITPMAPYYIHDRGEKIDYLRKNLIVERANQFPLTGVRKVYREKRCVRCGSISSVDESAEIIPRFRKKTASTTNNWDMAFHRLCFCGANWVSIG
ncbi:Sin4 protein [Saccharomycopsis crataegensis]|uniref:Mediator of RNA polymerase II transcription subunit 16 n=1 Tax=Saccharomycopsis crataegensis TaxID=43959 RepID=A0AAV5QEN5_9ASCO|nr:Sin4 protein [Saccharomycopsis crataegensis]